MRWLWCVSPSGYQIEWQKDWLLSFPPGFMSLWQVPISFLPLTSLLLSLSFSLPAAGWRPYNVIIRMNKGFVLPIRNKQAMKEVLLWRVAFVFSMNTQWEHFLSSFKSRFQFIGVCFPPANDFWFPQKERKKQSSNKAIKDALMMIVFIGFLQNNFSTHFTVIPSFLLRC